jgi:glycosyltransferase involved in cell wall biosynthesis
MMLYKLLSHSDRERFEPAVISLIERGTLGARIETLGIPVFAVGMKRGMPTPVAIWHLIRLARRLKPALLQGWMPHGNLAALLIGTFVPGPVPVMWNIRRSLYSSEYDKPLTKATTVLGAQLSGLPVKILYNSRVGAVQHEEFGYRPDKTLVVPNGFDTELFAPSVEARNSVRVELGLAKDVIIIGLAGRYSPTKDHANCLRAAKLLLKSHADVHFVLFGREVDWKNQALGRLVRDLGIGERVHLLGERHDVPRLTAALDIASSSSFEEGFSNVVGEAMSCGVPCVVTDVGDSAWIVGETGRVVPPCDPEALCAAWRGLIEMEAAARRKLGTRARRRIKDEFSIEKIAQQYDKIYGEQLHGT